MKLELVNADKNNVRPAPFWAYKVLLAGKPIDNVVSIKFELNIWSAYPYVEVVYVDEQNQHQITKAALSSVVFSADTIELC